MLYRNIKTGAEIEFSSEILAPDWKPVKELKAHEEAPIKEPSLVEPKETTPKAKKTKSAPKKRAKK